jgi:hypothetical protein
MEPLAGIEEAIHASPGECTVCHNGHGATIRCSDPRCNAVFHPLCAWCECRFALRCEARRRGDRAAALGCARRYGGLLMSVEAVGMQAIYDVWCPSHTPEAGGVQRNLAQQKDMRNRGRQDQVRTVSSSLRGD